MCTYIYKNKYSYMYKYLYLYYISKKINVLEHRWPHGRARRLVVADFGFPGARLAGVHQENQACCNWWLYDV
jgi:hypothetical protein